MKRSVKLSITYSLRALPILCVLLALCISEGVGLQLLPLRNATPVTTELLNLSSARNSSGPPTSDSCIFRKVDISRPTLSRVAIEQQINDFLGLPSYIVCDVAEEVLLPQTTFSSESSYSATFFPRPTGRAPPFRA